MRRAAVYILVFMMVPMLFAACRQHRDTSLQSGSEQKQDSVSDTSSVVVPGSAEGADRAPVVKVRRESIYSFSLHYPETLKGRYPLILFIPGWGSVHYEDYRTLIDYLVSLGNIVLFAPEYANEYGIQ